MAVLLPTIPTVKCRPYKSFRAVIGVTKLGDCSHRVAPKVTVDTEKWVVSALISAASPVLGILAWLSLGSGADDAAELGRAAAGEGYVRKNSRAIFSQSWSGS